MIFAGSNIVHKLRRMEADWSAKSPEDREAALERWSQQHAYENRPRWNAERRYETKADACRRNMESAGRRGDLRRASYWQNCYTRWAFFSEDHRTEGVFGS
jgi:hypothetical protein